MKPKISTGYLTPQAKKTKKTRNRLSETEESENPVFDEDLFQTLMKCPEKKKMVLQLLASNKEAIDKYKTKVDRASPLGKLKIKKKTCESPTALLRRRALEQMNTSPSTSKGSESSRPNSRLSEASSYHSSPVPFEKVLNGVIAYVEIKSRHDTDRSGGAKAVLKSMGAKIREKFTNDVTHVIFKDGSYTTFQRAKLMKLHLVSILWVELCRKTMQRQNEKQYPAMRCGFDDETMVCSQMQKEYEDIIRDEYRRSIVQGTPLPTTRSLIDRRRTLMTPSFTNLNTSSSSSFKTANDKVSSQDISDKEVATINGFQLSQNICTEDLVMNDPNCFSEVSGPVVNGNVIEIKKTVLKSVENIECSDMELTDINTQSLICRSHIFDQIGKTPNSDMEITRIPDPYLHTPRQTQATLPIPPRNLSRSIFDRRKTICPSFLSSDSSTTSLIISDKSSKGASLKSDKQTNVSNKTSLISSDNSTNVSKDVSLISSNKSTNISKDDSVISSSKSTNISDISFAVPKATSRGSRRLTRESSCSLIGPNESFIFGKNSAKIKKALCSELDKTASAMSELKLTSNTDLSKSTEKHLQVSSESKGKNSTSLSELKLTSESLKNTAGSSVMSSLRFSSGETHQPPRKSFTSVKDLKASDKSSMSILEVSSDKIKVTAESLMSSLQVSTRASNEILPFNTNNENNGISSFASSDNSSPSSVTPVIEGIIKALQTPEFITVRKKSGLTSSSKSEKSDDSEIILPRDYAKKHNMKKSELNINEEENEERETSAKKFLLNSNNEPNVLVNDLDCSTKKNLVVNIEKSHLDNIQNEEIQSKTRRRTLGVRVTQKKVMSKLTVRGRRKTSGPQQMQKNNAIEKPLLTKDIKKFKAQPKNVLKSTSDSSCSSDSSNDKPGNGNSSKIKRKLRKLYNPDDSIPIELDDEKEREEKRKQIRKRKSDERVFINPVDMLKSTKSPVPNETTSESDANEVTPPKRTRKNTKKKLTSFNSSSDEQKELLNEVLNKKTKGPQKTPKTQSADSLVSKSKVVTPAETPPSRKSTRIIKPTYKSQNLKNNGSSLDNTPAKTPSSGKSTRLTKPTTKSCNAKKTGSSSDEKTTVTITPFNRRSTMEFMSMSQFTSSTKRKNKSNTAKLPTIVCTKLHKADVQVFGQIVKKLGKFIVHDEVSDRTTHLIAGEPKRTINMLRAISRGCWILNFEWVLQSLEKGKWLPEEAFEVTDFSPSVQKCRLERQALGKRYSLDVFESCPPIYVAASTNPRCSDLKELITTCKGKIVTSTRMAKIVVGQYLQQEGTVCVHETWVLDCITFYRKMPFKEKYVICSKRKSLAV